MPTEKFCRRCERTKSSEDFPVNAKRSDGLHTYCRECHNAQGRASKRKHREKCLDYNRAYRAANVETVRSWGKRQYDSDPNRRTSQAKGWRGTRHGSIRMMFLAARSRAAKKLIDFDLSPEIIDVAIRLQSERCALTGIVFVYEHSEEHLFRPFAPSLDRKDNSKGYTFDNIQIVCTIVNKARNEYSLDLFDQMCRARVEQLNRG